MNYTVCCVSDAATGGGGADILAPGLQSKYESKHKT